MFYVACLLNSVELSFEQEPFEQNIIEAVAPY